MFPALHGIVAQGEANVATYTVTTTGVQTHTIQSFGVVAPVRVDWGDGSHDIFTGVATRTHVYPGAGTWLVTIRTPQYVNVFDMRDSKVTLNSRNIAKMRNVQTFVATGLRNDSVLNSSDLAAWRPQNFWLHSMPAGFGGSFNSVDLAAWRPTDFRLYVMPTGFGGSFNSADLAEWRPQNFRLYSMPAGFGGSFNSTHLANWRPAFFYLHSMPTGFGGSFNSADLAEWRPTNFYFYSISGGLTGLFSSANVADWRPADFRLYSMPAGYNCTINSAHLSAWRPGIFHLHNMTFATFSFFAGGGFANWITTNNFQMHNNALPSATVNAVLWELYQATAAPRTVTGGTINVAGSNAAPSGTFQAATSCPVSVATPGKEVAHELLNDGCGVGFNRWSTVSFTA